MTLTLEEWMKLPHNEKMKRGYELTPKDCSVLRTSYMAPVAENTGEYTEFTEEEKKQNDRDFEKILKEFGVMEQDETLDGWKDK